MNDEELVKVKTIIKACDLVIKEIEKLAGLTKDEVLQASLFLLSNQIKWACMQSEDHFRKAFNIKPPAK